MVIEWFKENLLEGFATIEKHGIVLNKTASKCLEYATAVRVGIDKEKKRVVLKALSLDEYQNIEENKENALKLSVATSYTKISNTALVHRLEEIFGFSAGRSIKIPAVFDTKLNYLILNMKEV
ncbi:MAG: hypothetical protein LBR37_04145 [Erysipelotrichaceae bacterium]|jgi:hypothetical protein|nr:hypothetical protein [Erysipelotrichaceae bacterium]